MTTEVDWSGEMSLSPAECLQKANQELREEALKNRGDFDSGSEEDSPFYDERETEVLAKFVSDPVNHPSHYTSHPSGVECIQVAEHFGFCIGNALKYLWRADLKNDAVEDLKKARWYIDREIQRRTSGV